MKKCLPLRKKRKLGTCRRICREQIFTLKFRLKGDRMLNILISTGIAAGVLGLSVSASTVALVTVINLLTKLIDKGE